MKQTAGSVRCLCRAAGPSRQQTARYFASSSHIPRIAPLPHRSVLEISGPDAQKFLKGLSSKDVEALGGGYSGFLNASGRVVHGSFIIPVAKAKVPTYYIIHDSPSDHPQPLEQLLPPFKLRSKVKIRDVSAEWDVWASFDYPDATHRQPVRKWKLGSGGAAESQWSWGDEGVLDLGLAENEFGCWDLRAGFGQGKLGRQLLTSKGDKRGYHVRPLTSVADNALINPASLSSHYDSVDVNAYHLRRMVLGVPEGFREIVPGVALPLESDMDIQGGVDFRKGCYLGQELTVRTYHTGATRKRILSLSLENPSDRSATPKFSREILEGGLDLIYHPPASSASKKARSAGRLLSLHPVASNIGLGLIRLEMAEKSCWSLGPPEDTGRLSVELDGQSWDVVAEKGESLASAEEEARSISHSR